MFIGLGVAAGTMVMQVGWTAAAARVSLYWLHGHVARGRKVRTPQGSVPDNVRDPGVKAWRRQVPQRKYRRFVRKGETVRVKRCGKSAPLAL